MVWVVLQYILLLAGMFMVGQFIVGIFNWRRRENNVIYRFFGVLTQPVFRIARVLSPRVVLDQHIPLVAFFLVCFGYIFVVAMLYRECTADLTQVGCQRLADHRATQSK